MAQPFAAAGISRKDGAGADGIHLLWTAPQKAGYAAEGYDVQRRVTQLREIQTSCYTFTTDDLQKLRDEFRCDTPLGRVRLRPTQCPEFPPTLPDEPFTGDVHPLRPLTCLNFLELPAGLGPNPLIERGIAFLADDLDIAPPKQTEIVTEKGLACAPRFTIRIPSRPRVVEMTLLRFDDEPVTVERYKDDGSLAETKSTTGPPGKPQTLRFSGGGIHGLTVVRGGRLTYLQTLCYESPRCIDFGPLPLGAGPNPRIEQGVSFRRYTVDNRIAPQGVVRTIGDFTGLDCGFWLEVQWADESKGLELTLMSAAQPATATVYSRDGTKAVKNTTAPAGKAETLRFGGSGILRVEVSCPSDETLLLSFCLNPASCVDFSALQLGSGPNPRVEQGATFRLVGSPPPTPAVTSPASLGSPPLASTNIVKRGDVTGLDCGEELAIQFSSVSPAVTLKLAYFGVATTVLAFHADGTSAGQRTLSSQSRQIETVYFEGVTSIIILAPRGGVLLLSCCFDTTIAPGGNPADFGRPSQYPTAQLPVLTAPSDRSGCWRYELDLGAHQFALVSAAVPSMLAIALRDGKAMDTLTSGFSTGVQDVAFRDRPLDQVLLYTTQLATFLKICVDVPLDAIQEDAEWAAVPYIAKQIQLPLVTVNPALATAADENTLASSRLLAGEVFDATAFRMVADSMNAVGAFQALAAPVWYTTMLRESTNDPFMEIRVWPFALALLVHATLRRELGFGYFDSGANLTPGVSYDYRITGRFRRRDVEEELLGFHAVPLDTTLPLSFHLGQVAFNANQSLKVTTPQPIPVNALSGVFRKGIQLSNAVLSIVFPAAVKKMVLEFSLDVPIALNYSARASSYFTGLSALLHAGPVPSQSRVELQFPEPIDTLQLQGSGFLFGIRNVNSPAGTSPDEIVPKSVVLRAITYEATAPPLSPPFLGTTNLQVPPIVGDPALSTQNPPQALGFRLHLLTPPLGGSSGQVPWPSDIGAFPPFDAMAFQLERRRVDTGDPFKSLDGSGQPTLYFGNRGRRKQSGPLYYGADLLQAFPEVVSSEPPVPLFIEHDDVLASLNPDRNPDVNKQGPPPGSLYQYRAFAVDAIGRLSSPATVGSVVALKKAVPPPQPVGPTGQMPNGVTLPAGVRARVLQASDPNLPLTDLSLLGSSRTAIVLEWGWTQAERDRDPYATGFRIYFNPTPPDIVHGTLTGLPSKVGLYYEMLADLDQPLAANAMAGRYLQGGGYPFKVASHTGGASIAIRFEPSVLQADRAPASGSFEFRPTLNGSEMRPAAWPERTAIVPITGATDYQYIFQNRPTIDAAHSTVRVWVGVSAADDQSYVADELPAIRPNGGQPGNESSIAAVAVQAGYIGRPQFNAPPPLANVPEVVTDEPVGGDAQVRLDLPALLPTVTIPLGHQVTLERIAFDALIALISARNDDTIGIAFADGSLDSYKLQDSADHAVFLAQIRTSTPGLVENRFLMDVLLHFRMQLESLWAPALPGAAAFGILTDSLPAKAGRYAYRIKLADEARHVSAASAILPQVLRVPSLRSPAAPSFEVQNSDTDTLTVSARVHDAFDLKWLLLFVLAQDAFNQPDGRSLDKPQLLRLPNRRDLYPMDGIRLRLRDGTLLAPAVALAVSSGASVLPDRLLTASLSVGYEQRVSVWAVSMTRDGITSRFAGPRTAFSGPVPIVIPVLQVMFYNGQHTATWGPPASLSDELAIERSTDGGTTWNRVSPWLSSTSPRSRTMGAVSNAQYRLVVRGSRYQLVTGPAVTPVA